MVSNGSILCSFRLAFSLNVLSAFICYIERLCVTLTGARSVMVIVVGNGHGATRVQILDETDCISHSTNNLGKGRNPIILPPAMGK